VDVTTTGWFGLAAPAGVPEAVLAKLDEALTAEFKVQDITSQTLDEDFKRPPPAHRSWSIEQHG